MTSPLRHVVYVLKDPRTLETMYVGRTDNEARRFSQHIKEALEKGAHSSGDERLRWLSALRAVGAAPIFEVVERYATKSQAVHAENKLIKKLLSNGADLVNVSVAAGVRRKAAKPSAAQQLRALRERVAKLERVLGAIAADGAGSASGHSTRCVIDDEGDIARCAPGCGVALAREALHG